jgi:twitching motility protein PilT
VRGDGESATVQLGGRAFRAEANRFGARVVVRILRGPRGTTVIPRVGIPAQDPSSKAAGVLPFVAFKPSAPRPVEPKKVPDSRATTPESKATPPDAKTPDAKTPPESTSEPRSGSTPDPSALLDPAPPGGTSTRPTSRPRPSTLLPPPPPRRTTIAPPIGNPLPPIRDRMPGAMPEFVALVEATRKRRGTDLHVTVGQPAMVRTSEGLVPCGDALAADDVDALLLPLLTPAQKAQLDQRGYVDAAIDLGEVARLRMNLSRTRAGLKGAFRIVMTTPPALEQLGLPVELARVTTYHQGLALIAGPNGHGKTTTMAALVDLINRTKAHHILTVEDPVEIIHPRKRAVISQREVGTHTRSFATALKASLREDPDVIVIGELRDRETVEIALTAAETGHLVMATTSTPSAAKTLDRIIDMFPPADQPQVRSSLAAALRFVLAQRLLPGADGESLVAAVELVTGVLPLATLIRDDKLYQLGSLLQRGRAFGMIRLDDSLAELVRAGRITEQVAMRYADSRKDLEIALHGKPEAAAPAKKGFGLFGKKDRD